MKNMAATDKFGYHEVLHTAHIMSSMWDKHILEHLAVDSNPELKAAAELISDKIGDFYQLVGAQSDLIFGKDKV